MDSKTAPATMKTVSRLPHATYIADLLVSEQKNVHKTCSKLYTADYTEVQLVAPLFL